MLYWRNIAGNTIAETDSAGATNNSSYHEYVFFAGRRIARADWGSSAFTVYYYFVDHLGSTRSMTSAAGSVCFKADYLPYGAENTPSGFTDTCNSTYKFTGYERDGETGLDYAFARYYNQRLGRFMSGDPLAGDTGDPQSLNRYAYVRNNPINFTDPTGMFISCTPDDPCPSAPEPPTVGPNSTCLRGGTWPNCNDDPNHNPESPDPPEDVGCRFNVYCPNRVVRIYPQKLVPKPSQSWWKAAKEFVNRHSGSGSCAQVFENTVSAPVKGLQTLAGLAPTVVRALQAGAAGSAMYLQQAGTMIQAGAVDASEAAGPLSTVATVGTAALLAAPEIATAPVLAGLAGGVVLTYGLAKATVASFNGQCHW